MFLRLIKVAVDPEPFTGVVIVCAVVATGAGVGAAKVTFPTWVLVVRSSLLAIPLRLELGLGLLSLLSLLSTGVGELRKNRCQVGTLRALRLWRLRLQHRGLLRLLLLLLLRVRDCEDLLEIDALGRSRLTRL